MFLKNSESSGPPGDDDLRVLLGDEDFLCLRVGVGIVIYYVRRKKQLPDVRFVRYYMKKCPSPDKKNPRS